MQRVPRRRRARQRKCRCCGRLYTPDHRNLRQQKYCRAPECRRASKKASQQQWLSSEKGGDYFLGPQNVVRVQQWREHHPGYWKRGVSSTPDALQDPLPSEVIINQNVTWQLACSALQDVCSVQPALLIGLIASLTGSTLQDDIAETTRRFIDSGRNILGVALTT